MLVPAREERPLRRYLSASLNPENFDFPTTRERVRCLLGRSLVGNHGSRPGLENSLYKRGEGNREKHTPDSP